MSISNHETFAFGAYPRAHSTEVSGNRLYNLHALLPSILFAYSVSPYRVFGRQFNLLRRNDDSGIPCRKDSGGQDSWSHGNSLERENIPVHAFVRKGT